MTKSKIATTMLLMTAASAAYAQQANVTSEEESDSIDTVVVTGKFIETQSRAAMKMDVDALDTPFSVQNYGDSFLKAIETTNIGDLYGYMTGVQRAGNTGYDVSIRGFSVGGDDKYGIVVDGQPGLSGRFGSPPTIGVESIEVVKGPMSVLYGQMQPGGFINLVSKKPKADRQTTFDIKGNAFAGAGLSGGDATGFNFGVDTTGAFDADEKFLYRLVAEYGDKDGFRDYTFDDGIYVAPSFTWNASDATSVTVQFEYRESTTSFDNGLAAPNRDYHLIAPITTWYHEPGDERTEDGTAGVLSVRHEFSNGVTWNTSVRSVDNESNSKEYTVVAVRPNNLALSRRARHIINTRSWDYIDTNFNIEFDTGAISHKLLVGANGGEDTSQFNRLRFFNSGPCPGPLCFDIGIYDPVYGLVPDQDTLPAHNPATPALQNNRLATTEAIGIYLSDLITFNEHWKMSVGVRWSEESQKQEELRVGTPTQSKDFTGVVPSAGLIYQPNETVSLYASYAESYVPPDATAFDVNGLNPFDATGGTQYETGVKVEDLFDGKMNGTISIFSIDKTNTLNSFQCPLGICSEQVGAERSEGVELQVDVEPLPNWQMLIGYSYTDARVHKSNNPIQVDAQLTNTSSHNANFWSRYDVQDGPLKGFGFGLGAYYIGDRYGFLPTAANANTMLLPNYTVVDMALYYAFSRYSFNLKVGNLLDEEYFESAGSTAQTNIAAGNPRNVILSFRTRF